LAAPESNPGAQTEEKSGSLLVLALLAPLVGAAAGLLGAVFWLVLEAADRFRDALIAASSRAAPARCFPKSHRAFIPQAGLGQIILGNVGDLAVRLSPSDLQSGVVPVAVNSLCRHVLSKDETYQVLPPDRSLAFKYKIPARDENFRALERELIFHFGRVLIMHVIRPPPCCEIQDFWKEAGRKPIGPAASLARDEGPPSTLSGHSGRATASGAIDALRSVNRKNEWLAVRIEGIVDDWLYAHKPLSGSEQGQPDWLAF
jgi:hypothetical protein